MGVSLPPTADRRPWTADQARARQDESRGWPRYECIDGELLVTPGPPSAHYDAQLVLYGAYFADVPGDE